MSEHTNSGKGNKGKRITETVRQRTGNNRGQRRITENKKNNTGQEDREE